VRDLATQEEWTVPAKGRLWRGWADDAGRGATLLEVPAGSSGWPSQNTSCACRWCGRFAMSHGFYGWSGPDFTVEHVEGSTRRAAKVPEGEGSWHGPNDRGCNLVAASEKDDVETGPWRWACP
jgi:hypothetical protein